MKNTGFAFVLILAMGLAAVADGALRPGVGLPLTPSGNLTDTRSPPFVWSAASDATWHQVWLNRSNQTYLTKWVVSNTTWSVTNLPAGNYHWWVRGWNRDGYGPWSTNVDFTILPVMTGTCSPMAPVGTVTNTQRPQFRWSMADQATWYRVWIGKGGYKYSDTWVRGTNVWTPPWDMSAGDYDWWIRPWNADGYGDWSAAGHFREQYWRWTNYDFGTNDPSRYVVLGDSISAPGSGGGACWPVRVARLLGKEVVNLAVQGQMAADGVLRVPSVLSAYRPGFLLVLYGANDVIRGRSTESTVENLRSIVRAAKRNRTVPVLATLTPMIGRHDLYGSDVEDLNALIGLMARQEDILLVRLDWAFGDGWDFLSDDGLHPNEAGNALIAQAFYERLK